MNEDPTKELPGASPFEQRVLAEFRALRSEVGGVRGEVDSLRSEVTEIRTQQVAMAKNIATLDQRLTSLEERVDSRLKETRPIWEAVQAQLKKLDEKFTLFIRDLYDVRGDISLHEKRLAILSAAFCLRPFAVFLAEPEGWFSSSSIQASESSDMTSPLTV